MRELTAGPPGPRLDQLTRSGDGERPHTVQFYRDHAYLIEAITAFVREGLEGHEGVIVFATGPHLDALRRSLSFVELSQAIDRGQILFRDAHRTLGDIYADGCIDEARFREVVIRCIERARGGSTAQRVRVFGEIVEILSERGEVAPMLRLEELWNDVVQSQRVTLLCAYSFPRLADSAHTHVFDDICRRHDQVVATEVLQRLDEAMHRRSLAELEQRAEALEAEIAKRRQAQAETAHLLRLTEAANLADAVEQIYEPALDAVIAVLRADRAAISLFGADGAMRFHAWRGLSPSYRKAVEGHSPWGRDAVDATPLLVGDVEQAPAWRSFLPVFRAEGIRAVGFVPLVQQRRLIGELMICCRQPRMFSKHEVELARTVATQVSQTALRHELFAAERRARAEAERSARAREEVLAVVSHDLRNPLSTILMSASLLTTQPGDGGARVKQGAEKIHRAVRRMTRMLEDLVDFATIQAEHLSIGFEAARPLDIVEAAIDSLERAAHERELHIETSVATELPDVSCDPVRVTQALSNLLSNAIEVSPGGARVVVGAEAKDGELVFWVSDNGPGLDADDVKNVFQRYWRSKNAPYRGTGLGLTIAKGIVDAHRGRIWVDSTPGQGSRFAFTVPLRE
jgi:signal transduction histidine kinase